MSIIEYCYVFIIITYKTSLTHYITSYHLLKLMITRMIMLMMTMIEMYLSDFFFVLFYLLCTCYYFIYLFVCLCVYSLLKSS